MMNVRLLGQGKLDVEISARSKLDPERTSPVLYETLRLLHAPTRRAARPACPRGRNRCVEWALKSRRMFSRFTQGGTDMSARAVSQAVLYSLVMAGVFSPAHALTQQELVAKLESAGYSQ